MSLLSISLSINKRANLSWKENIKMQQTTIISIWTAGRWTRNDEIKRVDRIYITSYDYFFVISLGNNLRGKQTIIKALCFSFFSILKVIIVVVGGHNVTLHSVCYTKYMHADANLLINQIYNYILFNT